MNIATFATLINQKVVIPSARTQYVSIGKDHFVDFFRPTLEKIFLDQDWYLETYPDIAEAIANGVVTSARDHYITCGYYEHRLPYEIRVEEDWYLLQYPDVNDAVSKGLFASARSHYYAVGFKEGRFPHEHFSLRLADSPAVALRVVQQAR